MLLDKVKNLSFEISILNVRAQTLGNLHLVWATFMCEHNCTPTHQHIHDDQTTNKKIVDNILSIFLDKHLKIDSLTIPCNKLNYQHLVISIFISILGVSLLEPNFALTS